MSNSNRPEKWQLNDADIESDLTNTRPKWILSAYGPGRDTPAALFVDNEYSPEEIRLRYYQQESTGNGNAADLEAQQLWQKAVTDMLNVSRNIKDVQKFMETQEQIHPNRYDYCNMDGTVPKEEFAKKIEGNAQSAAAPSPFGGATQTTGTNPFSKPAAGSSPFAQGSSSFGQPAQPSAFGARPTTAFGQPTQPSAFGQPAQPSAFGQPSQPSAFGKPAFGQSSTPGQPAFGQTGFGQTAANQTNTKFGGSIQNVSPFGGAAAQNSSAFGQTSNLGQSTGGPAASSGFGVGSGFSQPVQPSAFGKPAFGSTAAPATGSPFGGSQNANPSPFGAPAAQTNNASPFSAAAAQAGNKSPFANAPQSSFSGGGFGGTGNQNNPNTPQQSSPFGQPQSQQAQNANPFSQAQPQNQQSGGFGQPQQPSQQPASPFGQPQQQTQQANPFGQKPPQAQSANAFGQPQQPQQPPANQNPFGQQQSTGFGQPTRPAAQPIQPNPNPFGATAQQPNPALQPQATVQPSKPTDKPVRPLHYTQTLPPGQTQTALGGKLSRYRNQPVEIIETYRPSADGVEVKDTEYPVYKRPDGKGLERIWFPNGLQEPTVQKLTRVVYDFQDADDAYNQQIKDQYGYLFENGSFKDHAIPLVPPERGWIDYDF